MLNSYATEEQAKAALPKASAKMGLLGNDKFTVERKTSLIDSTRHYWVVAMYSAQGHFCGYY